MLKIVFLLFMSAGIPVAVAMAGASLVYILWSGTLPGFVAMLVRSVQVSVVHWRRGYTVLERPESTMTDR